MFPGAMPLFPTRGGARPRTRLVRSVARQVMLRRRDVQRVRQEVGPAADSWAQAAADHVCVARADEAKVLFGCDGVQPIGLRRDKDISSDAVVLAAFAPDDSTAARATGLNEISVHRAQVVCCEALAQFQEARLRDIMGGLDGGFLVVKRSSDETPFHVRKGARDAATVIKLLNQRCFLRWSPTCATRAIFPAIELGDASAPGLLEAMERVSAELDIDAMRAAAARVDVCAQVHIMDSLAANTVAFEAWAGATPQVLHWRQRCDVHACQLITVRPLDARGLFDPMFCLHKVVAPRRHSGPLAEAHGADGRGGGVQRRHGDSGGAP